MCMTGIRLVSHLRANDFASGRSIQKTITLHRRGGGNIVVYIEKFKTVRGATTKDQCKVNERGIGSWQGALGPPLAMRK